MTATRNRKHTGVTPRNNNKYLINWVSTVTRKRHWDTVVATSSYQASQIRERKIVSQEDIDLGRTPIPIEEITISELWDMYEANSLKLVKVGQIFRKSLTATESSVINFKRLNPELTNKPINSITKNTIDTWRERLVDSKHKPGGINSYMTKFKSVLNWAIDQGYLESNPFKKIKPLPARKANGIRILDESEMDKLFDTVKTMDTSTQMLIDSRDIFIFLIYTGARASEACVPPSDDEQGLKWTGLDLKTKELSIQTKGRQTRTIIIEDMDQLIEMLIRRKKAYPESEGPFVNPGKQDNIDWVDNRVEKMLKIACIKNASAHDLRRTAGGYHYMANRDIVATQKFLGHADVDTTVKYYINLINRYKRETSMNYARTIKQFNK